MAERDSSSVEYAVIDGGAGGTTNTLDKTTNLGETVDSTAGDSGVPTYYSFDSLQDKSAGSMYDVLVKNPEGEGMLGGTLTFGNDGKYTIVNHTNGEVINNVDSSTIRALDVDPYRTRVDNYQTLSGTGNTSNESNIKVPDFEGTTPGVSESKYVRHNINTNEIVAKTKEDYIDYLVDKSRGYINREQAEQMADVDINGGRVHIVEGEGANISTSLTSNITAKYNGVGSTDMPDMHDDIMHHTHVTQKVGSGVYLGGDDDYTDSSQHYRQLQTDENGNVLVDENGYAKKNLSYKPGETKTLADNPYLAEISKGNILGNKDHSTFSKLDYICAYAATGQWSVKDLKVTVDYLASECDVKFAAHPEHYFGGTEFEKIYSEIESTDYDAKEAEIKSLVEELETKFKAKHDEMIGWCGSAYDSSTSAIQCILGKFEVTMGNILQALEPSCAAMKTFKENLKALKDKEQNELIPKKEEVENAKIAKEDAHGVWNSIHVPFRTYDKKTGKCTNSSEVHDAQRRKDNAWDEYQEKERIYNELVNQLEELMKVMDDMLLNVIMEYYQIKNYDQTVQSFSSYFGLGSGPDKSSMISSSSALLQNHDLIVSDFEEYSKMPVITNLSDYQVGDVIVFDDAHGYVYSVTGPFDPLTGTITIACHDKYGNKIGKDIVIWDQREIVPIRYVKEYDPDIYDDYPDTFLTTAPEEPLTPPVTDPTPTKPPVTNPPTNPVTNPPTNPVTNPPTNPPTNPVTNPPTNPVTNPPTNPVTNPPTNPNPYGPNTGLDAIYSSGDTTQSSSSLGALAGLAVGAAGLGLTGLMDKDENKEKDEDKDNSEEEKNDEVKEEQEMTTETSEKVDINE